MTWLGSGEFARLLSLIIPNIDRKNEHIQGHSKSSSRLFLLPLIMAFGTKEYEKKYVEWFDVFDRSTDFREPRKLARQFRHLVEVAIFILWCFLIFLKKKIWTLGSSRCIKSNAKKKFALSLMEISISIIPNEKYHFH